MLRSDKTPSRWSWRMAAPSPHRLRGILAWRTVRRWTVNGGACLEAGWVFTGLHWMRISASRIFLPASLRRRARIPSRSGWRAELKKAADGRSEPLSCGTVSSVVARSPDRATGSDRRSPRTIRIRALRGDLRSNTWQGQETLPQRGQGVAPLRSRLVQLRFAQSDRFGCVHNLRPGRRVNLDAVARPLRLRAFLDLAGHQDVAIG